MNRPLLTQSIKDMAIEQGADIVGIADLELLAGIFTHPRNLLETYKYGVSVVVSLKEHNGYDSETVDKAYANSERIARPVAEYIRSLGYESETVPCDKRVGSKGKLFWKGAISHKAVAKTAGLGWIGKSMLLITPAFGPRICLITVLTDMPLVPGHPEKNKCGNCRECIESCPIGALADLDFADHPDKLGGALDVSSCGPHVEKTWDMGNVCWSCLLACPFGKKQGRKGTASIL